MKRRLRFRPRFSILASRSAGVEGVTDWHVRPHRLPAAEKNLVVRELQEALHQRPEVLFALLHGSFIAEGPFRDIDLAVYVHSSAAKGVSFRDYESDLAVAFTLKVHMSVDVRVLNDAPVACRYHALKGLVLLVRDTEFLDAFRARTWDEYFDFASFARRSLREAIGG